MRLLTVMMIALYVVACGKQVDNPAIGKPPAMPPMPVGVATAIVRDLPTMQQFTGRLEAVQMVELRTRIGGTITEVTVADGSDVKAGDVIMRIDRAPVQATFALAEAEVARAEARRAQARLQFDRSKKLVADQIVTQQSFDEADAVLRTADAEIAAAIATRDRAKLDLGYTNVTAPINGKVGKILATTGNLVQASGLAPGTMLATLISSDPIYAVFDVEESLYHRISAQLLASAAANGIGPNAVPVSVALTGETVATHAGAIAFVDNAVDSASGSIRIRALLPNHRHVLIPGAFARIHLQIAPPRPIILINERVVLAQLNTRYVYTVHTVDGQDSIAIRPVQLGGVHEGFRIVTSGLDANDRIVVNNLVMLFPGRSISPMPASMESLQPLSLPGSATSAALTPSRFPK